jgi:hypothetical protein
MKPTHCVDSTPAAVWTRRTDGNRDRMCAAQSTAGSADGRPDEGARRLRHVLFAQRYHFRHVLRPTYFA